jgi:Zinc knuckle
VSEYKEAVKECFHLGQSARMTHMQDNGLDFETICVKFGEYFRTAKQDGKWLPCKNMRDTTTPPSNFGNLASNGGHKAMTLVQQGYSKNTSSAGVAGSGTCHNCGKEGHWATNCPSKGVNNTAGRGNTSGGRFGSQQAFGGRGRGGGGSGRGNGTVSWTRVPPGPNQSETKNQLGKTFHWCATCKRWTTSHGTAQHRGKQNTDEGQTTTTKVNFSVVENYAAWHCTTWVPENNPYWFSKRVKEVVKASIGPAVDVLVPFFLAAMVLMSVFGLVIGYHTALVTGTAFL